MTVLRVKGADPCQQEIGRGDADKVPYTVDVGKVTENGNYGHRSYNFDNVLKGTVESSEFADILTLAWQIAHRKPCMMPQRRNSCRM